MLNLPNESKYVHKEHIRISTIFFLLVLNAIIYYIPYRNNVHIGNLFGITLWFYFGILNAILLLLVYIIVRGEVILDFSTKELIFNEFKRSKSWDFTKILGIYLLSFDKEYLIRIRPQRLLTLDIRLNFEQAYEVIEKFKKEGLQFTIIRPDKPKRLTYSFPILLSKYERKPSKFNPEIPEWYRGITLRTKLISITLAPLLYIVGGTLVVRIPHLLEGLTATKGVVSVIYGLTAFVLFDGGLYFLFGVSFMVLLAKRIYKISSQPHSKDV